MSGRMIGPRGRGSTVARTVFQSVFAIVLATVMSVLLLSTLWPGHVKATRLVMCDDAHPDAFVVRSVEEGPATVSNPSGEHTAFSMFCVSGAGHSDEVGWLRPLLTIAPVHALGWAVVGGVTAARQRGNRGGPTSPGDGGPTSHGMM